MSNDLYIPKCRNNISKFRDLQDKIMGYFQENKKLVPNPYGVDIEKLQEITDNGFIISDIGRGKQGKWIARVDGDNTRTVSYIEGFFDGEYMVKLIELLVEDGLMVINCTDGTAYVKNDIGNNVNFENKSIKYRTCNKIQILENVSNRKLSQYIFENYYICYIISLDNDMDRLISSLEKASVLFRKEREDNEIARKKTFDSSWGSYFSSLIWKDNDNGDDVDRSMSEQIKENNISWSSWFFNIFFKKEDAMYNRLHITDSWLKYSSLLYLSQFSDICTVFTDTMTYEYNEISVNSNFNKYLNYSMVNNKRFFIWIIDILCYDDVFHQNIMIYDIDNKILERFNPHLNSNSSYVEPLVPKSIDEDIIIFLRKSYPYMYKVYYNDFLRTEKKYTFPLDKNNCLVWCIWYANLRMTNLELDREKIFIYMMDEIEKHNKDTVKSFSSFVEGVSKIINDEMDRTEQMHMIKYFVPSKRTSSVDKIKPGPVNLYMYRYKKNADINQMKENSLVLVRYNGEMHEAVVHKKNKKYSFRIKTIDGNNHELFYKNNMLFYEVLNTLPYEPIVVNDPHNIFKGRILAKDYVYVKLPYMVLREYPVNTLLIVKDLDNNYHKGYIALDKSGEKYVDCFQDKGYFSSREQKKIFLVLSKDTMLSFAKFIHDVSVYKFDKVITNAENYINEIRFGNEAEIKIRERKEAKKKEIEDKKKKEKDTLYKKLKENEEKKKKLEDEIKAARYAKMKDAILQNFVFKATSNFLTMTEDEFGDLPSYSIARVIKPTYRFISGKDIPYTEEQIRLNREKARQKKEEANKTWWGSLTYTINPFNWSVQEDDEIQQPQRQNKGQQQGQPQGQNKGQQGQPQGQNKGQQGQPQGQNKGQQPQGQNKGGQQGQPQGQTKGQQGQPQGQTKGQQPQGQTKGQQPQGQTKGQQQGQNKGQQPQKQKLDQVDTGGVKLEGLEVFNAQTIYEDDDLLFFDFDISEPAKININKSQELQDKYNKFIENLTPLYNFVYGNNGENFREMLSANKKVSVDIYQFLNDYEDLKDDTDKLQKYITNINKQIGNITKGTLISGENKYKQDIDGAMQTLKDIKDKLKILRVVDAAEMETVD